MKDALNIAWDVARAVWAYWFTWTPEERKLKRESDRAVKHFQKTLKQGKRND
jgi:hypothetical protein